MSAAFESRAVLQLITGEAVSASGELLKRFSGPPELQRAALLETVPPLIGYYANGSAALASDFYEATRERAGVATAFRAEPMVLDRTVKIRNAVAWASAPLFAELTLDAVARLSQVVQSEVSRPYRDTILHNRRGDKQSVGWRRIARAGACAFCRMLADNGAIYKKSTVRFAAHTDCHCIAEPAFKGDGGEEASVMQYRASQRGRTQKQRDSLRSYLKTVYPNIPG